MSMQSSFVYGYGFECREIDVKHFIKFINNHRQTICQTIENLHKNNDISERYPEALTNLVQFCGKYANDSDDKLETKIEEENIDISDLDDEFYETTNACAHMFSVIASIMTSETEIRFTYEPGQTDIDSYETVMFITAYPWQFNKTESQIASDDDLTEIIQPYTDELGLDKDEIGYQEVHYYG